jgi:hypothetical protein
MSPAEQQPDDGLARLRERIEATRRVAAQMAGDLESALSHPHEQPPGSGETPAPAGASTEGATSEGATPEGAPSTGPRGRAGGPPPPMGYATPPPAPGTSTLVELEGLARRLRELLPDELAHELAELVRELLLLVRALIDWTLDRLDRRRAEPVQVTDIPIA